MSIRFPFIHLPLPYFAADDERDASAGANTLDDVVSKAMEGYDDGDAPVEKAEAAEDGSPADDKSARTRGPDGRFTSSQASDAPASADAPGSAEVVEKTATAEAAQPAPIQAQSLAPPEAWTAEDKAAFGKLPVEGQKLLLDRHANMQADYTRKTQEIAAFRRDAEPVLQVISPYAKYIESLGRRPAEAVQTLLGVEYALRNGTPEQKAGLLAQFSVDYNIPLANAYQLIQQGRITKPVPLNPQTHQQLRQSDERLTALERRNAELEQAQNQRQATVEIEAFKTAKNADGTPKYPQLDRVIGAMGDWLRSAPPELQDKSPSQMLEAAYARFGKPIDDAIQAQVVAQQQQRSQANAAAVARAKGAAPVRSNGTTPHGTTTPKGADAHVAAAMAKLGFDG